MEKDLVEGYPAVCVSNTGKEDCLTEGKEYDILVYDKGLEAVIIENDKGDTLTYYAIRFEQK